MELGVGDVGDFGIEEVNEASHEAAFGLTLFAEHEDIVFGEQGEADVGDDGVVVADDAGEEGLMMGEFFEEVIVELLLDGFGFPAGLFELAKGCGFLGGGDFHKVKSLDFFSLARNWVLYSKTG